MITVRVSHLNAYARWRDDPDAELPALLAMLTSAGGETEVMRKGTAFHKVLELSRAGMELDHVTQDGYTFCFTGDFELYIPPMRERR